MTWATNDRGEDGPRGIITGETGLAHAGAIVNDQCCNVVVTHFDLSAKGKDKKRHVRQGEKDERVRGERDREKGKIEARMRRGAAGEMIGGSCQTVWQSSSL